MQRLIAATVLFACLESLALGEALTMSQSKLTTLGLSSMKGVDDVQGLEVRGRGFGSLGFNVQLGAGPNIGRWTGALGFGQDPITIGTLRTGDLGNVDATNTLVPFTLQFSQVENVEGFFTQQIVATGFGHIFSRGSN